MKNFDFIKYIIRNKINILYEKTKTFFYSFGFFQNKRRQFVLLFFLFAVVFFLSFFCFKKEKKDNIENVGSALLSEDFSGDVAGDSKSVEGGSNDSWEFEEDRSYSSQSSFSFLDFFGKIFTPNIIEKRIIKVPEDFPKIQDAVDDAKSGDVVLVSAGEYKENLVMKDGVSVIGVDVLATVIDGQKNGNVVTIKDLSDNETRLEGFTIKNSGENLSGVMIENCSPIINRNIIFDNDYNIYIKGNSAPTIQKNKLSGSKSGIQIFNLEYVSGYKPIIVDNIIYKNKKGINIYNGEAIVEHNTISFNSYYKDDLGATFGIYFASATGTVKNNIITDNGICELCSGVYVDEKSKGVVISYNDLWNNRNNFVCFGDCSMEDSNFSEDPEFLSEENYALEEGSIFINSASDGQRLGSRL